MSNSPRNKRNLSRQMQGAIAKIKTQYKNAVYLDDEEDLPRQTPTRPAAAKAPSSRQNDAQLNRSAMLRAYHNSLLPRQFLTEHHASPPTTLAHSLLPTSELPLHTIDDVVTEEMLNQGTTTIKPPRPSPAKRLYQQGHPPSSPRMLQFNHNETIDGGKSVLSLAAGAATATVTGQWKEAPAAAATAALDAASAEPHTTSSHPFVLLPHAPSYSINFTTPVLDQPHQQPVPLQPQTRISSPHSVQRTGLPATNAKGKAAKTASNSKYASRTTKETGVFAPTRADTSPTSSEAVDLIEDDDFVDLLRYGTIVSMDDVPSGDNVRIVGMIVIE